MVLLLVQFTREEIWRPDCKFTQIVKIVLLPSILCAVLKFSFFWFFVCFFMIVYLWNECCLFCVYSILSSHLSVLHCYNLRHLQPHLNLNLTSPQPNLNLMHSLTHLLLLLLLFTHCQDSCLCTWNTHTYTYIHTLLPSSL